MTVARSVCISLICLTILNRMGSGVVLVGWGVVVGGDLKIGVKFLRNLLFLSVSLPVPSTPTLYWSWSLVSTTVTVLSQRLGLFPAWFWGSILSSVCHGTMWISVHNHPVTITCIAGWAGGPEGSTWPSCSSPCTPTWSWRYPPPYQARIQCHWPLLSSYQCPGEQQEQVE